MPISSILFSSTLILGTLTSLTAPNWFIAWLGIEINLLSFIPLITFHLTGPSADKTSGACKYFIAQATGSILFLLAPAIWITDWNSLSPIFIFLALMTKAGMAPIFQWFPSTIASLPWLSASLLLTWQKLTPLLILFSLELNSTLLPILLILSILNTLIGALYGLAQTQLRPLLAFSSIAHIGWILAVSTISSPAARGYLFAYILIVLPLLAIFVGSRTISPKTIFILNSISPTHRALVTTLMLNLAGLPPLGGFCLKAASLSLLITTTPLVPLVLIASSVITLGFYVHISLLTVISTQDSPAPKSITPIPINSFLALATYSALTLPAFPILML